jgi:hypothetical protein
MIQVKACDARCKDLPTSNLILKPTFCSIATHTPITGLVRSGATIMEAKELARHADIRQTMKYTHIGMEDRAEALAGLPSPFTSADVDCLHYVCNSGGVLSQKLSRDVSDSGIGRKLKKRASPGPAGACVVSCHKPSPVNSVRYSGGGGNCTRVPRSFGNGLYVCSRSFECQPRGPDRQGPLRLIPS